nr:MAG: hypothetical protein [Molluscum contagiosum virus]
MCETGLLKTEGNFLSNWHSISKKRYVCVTSKRGTRVAKARRGAAQWKQRAHTGSSSASGTR